jgi:hypothetical protein
LADASGLNLEFVKNGKYNTPTLDYTERIEIHNESIFPETEYVIIDEGRTASEKSLVLVRGTHVIGYGFVEDESNDQLFHTDDLTRRFDPLPELELVIRKYTEKGRFQKKVVLD